MHNWLMRNASMLALLLILGLLALAGLMLLSRLGSLLRLIDRASFWEIFVGGGATLLIAAMYLLGIALAYALLLRFLALCDDIAAIRRQQTGTPSSLD